MAAVLVGVAALVVVFSGEDKRAPADNWITVRDSTGRLTLRVPPTWKKQPAEGWSPAEVQLTDQGTAPALRATPELAKFREVGQPVPGVFVGLSSDVAPGKLPPPGLQRPGCTPQPEKSQQAAGLNGNVVALSCPNGITYQEVGLYDPGKRFAVWVEIKQAGGPDLAAKILGSLRVRPQ